MKWKTITVLSNNSGSEKQVEGDDDIGFIFEKENDLLIEKLQQLLTPNQLERKIKWKLIHRSIQKV